MRREISVGVSLKMYFGHRQAEEWFRQVADVAAEYRAVAYGDVDLFVIPTFLQIPDALMYFSGTNVTVGAQDVAAWDSGPYTGEVSAAELSEIGVRIAEIGHAERRRLFGDTDRVVARKVAAAVRNGVTPLICVGEKKRTTPEDAAAAAIAQLQSALADSPRATDVSDAILQRVIVAYEPVWAIGAPQPAPVEHIRTVTRALQEALRFLRPYSAVIYGGSAGPGLLTELADDADGLFLGRFAHDPQALRAVLDEASALVGSRETRR